MPRDTDMMKEKYFKFNNTKDKTIRTIEVYFQFLF